MKNGVDREGSELWLDFFGTFVLVKAMLDDERAIRFFFRNHLRTAAPPAEKMADHVHLCIEGGSFFESLLAKDDREKATTIIEPGERPVTRTFRSWSGAPSPLPPFSIGSLRRRIGVIPGACLETPSGTGLLIVGSNHSGKTDLVLHHARAGGRVVSDHLTVLDIESGNVLPYNTPVGFRGRTLGVYRHALARVATRRTVSEVTGEVRLAHLDDLFQVPLQRRIPNHLRSVSHR